MAMYILHWEYMAGSIVVQAMLEEMRADFQMHHVDMEAGAHKLPDYQCINPTGRVPALGIPDGTTIGETAAIVTVLGEQFPDAGLVPQLGHQDRPCFLFWLNVMATAGYLTVAREGHPERYAFDIAAIQQVKNKAGSDLCEFFDLMDRSISGDPFFLMQGFTALDIYLTMLSEWFPDKDDLFSSRPALAELCTTVKQRPAYQTAIETHLLPQQAA